MPGKRRKPPQSSNRPESRDGPRRPVGLRIIGGRFRGRKLQYTGDLRTRPMKDRLREAVFNLVGPAIVGTHAIDLFAGTGALGLEALSRGARQATFFEVHRPTAETIRRNVSELGAEELSQVVAGNVFIWAKRRPELGNVPCTAFCSPPYDFYVDRREEMLEMIAGLMQSSRPESIFVVEADERFDFRLLPDPDGWDVRCYPPAVVGIYRKG
jgi:16S rRNA (guanine966-N2)-methyltransferase